MRRHRLTIAAVFAAASIACGKKGPPLPPLVKLPAAPADFTAVRRGSDVDVQFTVPAANTDGTRPANVERVDVYAFTGAAPLSDDQIVKLATRVGSVAVKAPRDPDLTADVDEPEEETEAPEGSGLDQGATARVDEALNAAALAPLELPRRGKKPPEEGDRALLGPPPTPLIRHYVAVGFGVRGKRGPLSKRVGVPLIEPPAPPAGAVADYDESRIVVTWRPPDGAPAPTPNGVATDGATLPSRPIGFTAPQIAYNVYESAPTGETRLTKSPVADPAFTDTRMTWGAERCYVVRTVETIAGVSVESGAAAAPCRKLVDTFPPAAPKELHAVAGEGSINLIWAPSGEKDLAGYIVLRGTASDATLQPLTPKPIPDARFTDQVRPGVAYTYAVQAVDKAGNVSAMSNRVDETAR